MLDQCVYINFHLFLFFNLFIAKLINLLLKSVNTLLSPMEWYLLYITLTRCFKNKRSKISAFFLHWRWSTTQLNFEGPEDWGREFRNELMSDATHLVYIEEVVSKKKIPDCQRQSFLLLLGSLWQEFSIFTWAKLAQVNGQREPKLPLP